MVSLIVDSGYERLSNTIPVSPAYKSSKIALLCAKIKLKIAFSNHLRTSILKTCSGPNHCGLYSRSSLITREYLANRTF